MFDLTTEEARLLLNVALMATGGNRFRSAAKILAALERFRPEAPSVASAKVVALMSAGKHEDALAYIDGDALPHFPGNPMLLAFKGMTLVNLDRKQEAREPLLAAAGQESDPAAAQLAKGLLDND